MLPPVARQVDYEPVAERRPYGCRMSRVPIEPSRGERRIGSVVALIATVGSFGAGVISNIIGRWWPSIAVLIFVVLAVPISAVYFARTRHRSIRSVLALGLPTFPDRSRATGTAILESSRVGWFPDPARRHQLRFFDGHNWTDVVRDDGVDSGDVLGPPPANRDAWLSPEIMVVVTNSQRTPELETPSLRSRVGPRAFAAIVVLVVLVGVVATVLALLHPKQAGTAALVACGLGALVMRMVVTSDDDD